MAAAVEQRKREGSLVLEEDNAHLSPPHFEHINPYGKFSFEENGGRDSTPTQTGAGSIGRMVYHGARHQE
jgi:Tn3 transposase DDE domain-containing protein